MIIAFYDLPFYCSSFSDICAIKAKLVQEGYEVLMFEN